ncbi:metallophosphoesterase family protein [Companilactobacillus sp. HBUAS56275]|uniref:Metallophosphoesterase family protein n=1 Tax=Candidatus Companilactobacillus pullicola TaxID=2838523 RepID=A0A9D2CQ06_9LACO|nr:metallophosphoesterase family protein [Candidatus Companilactobacillus pullicola]
MIHKIAVFSDVHGNVTALNAVLKDAKKNGATDYWFLGDLFLPGPGAEKLYKTVKSLHPAVWLQGNWEQEINSIVDGEADYDDPSEVYLSRLTEYLINNLKPKHYQKLIQRPISTTITVNGLKFGLSHNQAERSTGHDLFPAEAQKNFDHLAGDKDVLLYGHTHQQVMRTSSKGQLIINPGATGQPYSPYAKFMEDQRACYTILTVDDESRIEVDFRKVSYDVDKEIKLAQSKDLPYIHLYEHLRKTGFTVTHDQKLLKKVNSEYHYRHEVRKFFNK